MWDFSIGRSLSMMAKTAPFVVFRIIVYFGIAVAYVLVTGVGAGVGWGVGAFGDDEFRAASTFWGGTIGFGLTAGVIYFLRRGHPLHRQGRSHRRAAEAHGRGAGARWAGADRLCRGGC